jgi:hypothetical protein
LKSSRLAHLLAFLEHCLLFMVRAGAVVQQQKKRARACDSDPLIYLTILCETDRMIAQKARQT